MTYQNKLVRSLVFINSTWVAKSHDAINNKYFINKYNLWYIHILGIFLKFFIFFGRPLIIPAGFFLSVILFSLNE